ncbi:MAG: LytTR family transcriptional regulator [Cytophagaceae bacterium]|nr:LytTR family transcriptional regulator [Cytophagaceae bacterium]MBK9511035.1 LytTR family transcriptional regulator [Cytophagaceae bacterium]MBK9933447.1 LytTR family transcriptional regulator [Cytophagaceae bacterium]MBL0302836.1 LytTR family transcriptional regulator [Cytophagaceae bacterium]MBL0325663.1 LytTR family transcriptional regulator [Cytophagaceae bacterium]
MSFLNKIKSSVKSAFNTFKKPYHSSTLSFRGFLHALAIATIIFLLLYLVKPFGLSFLETEQRNMAISISGLIALGAMLLCEFVLPLLAKEYFDEHHWTGSKQLVQSLLMSFLIIAGLGIYWNTIPLSGFSFPVDSILYFVYSIIPIIIFIYLQENIHTNKFTKKAENLNYELASKNIINSENPLKILVFLGHGEKLSLIPNQLIYAKISENSTEFYYQNPLGIDKSIINITEKEVREELGHHPQFIKFHKNIVLNANAIMKVTGNARGYEIAIAKVNELVKVSNRYRKNLENI